MFLFEGMEQNRAIVKMVMVTPDILLLFHLNPSIVKTCVHTIFTR